MIIGEGLERPILALEIPDVSPVQMLGLEKVEFFCQ